MAFRYLANEHIVKKKKKTPGLTHWRLWTCIVWVLFFFLEKKNFLKEKWKYKGLICNFYGGLIMPAYCTVCPCSFIVCTGDNPRIRHCFIQVNRSEAQAGSQHAGWKQAVATVIISSRHSQGWLPVLFEASPSLSSSGSTGRRRKREELSLASGLICFHFRPQAQCLALTEVG